MSFLKYQQYAESGVRWLGEVPAHWKVGRLKNMLKIRGGQDYKLVESDNPLHYPVIGSGGQFTFARKFIYDGESVLLGRKGTIDKPLFVRGKFWTVDTMFYTEVLPRTNGKYAYYAATTIPFGYYSTSTALPSMSQFDLANHRLPIPQSYEQTQIARFLDHETAKIDALIAEQKRLIKLLQEKRQAVISHAVTKGLDPNVPMKDSGVEWLGEVPAHWEVSRMRFVCRITTGNRDTQDAEPEGAYPFFVRSDTIERSNAYCFDGEGVFTSGDGAGVGKIFHYYRGKCAIHQRVYLFHSFRLTTGKFFYHYLRSNLEPVVLSQSAKSTVDSLRLPMLQNFWMTIPPKNEQVDIDAFIEDLETKTCRLLTDCQSSIELLLERRSALISAAVTGKIDVRDWQPPADESAFDEDVRKAGMVAST